MRRAIPFVLIVLLVGLQPLAALAHGTEIRVSSSGAKPSQLTVYTGTTVHFQNANLGGTVCTIVAEDHSFESPPLHKGEGWHHTFDEPGTFHFTTKESSSVQGTIVVGARP